MDSRVLADRLRGGLAAYFLTLGLIRVSQVLLTLAIQHDTQSSDDSASRIFGFAFSLGVHVFLAAWLFLDKKFATTLALVYSAVMMITSASVAFMSLSPRFSVSTTGVTLDGPVHYTVASLSFSMLIAYTVALFSVLSLRRVEK